MNYRTASLLLGSVFVCAFIPGPGAANPATERYNSYNEIPPILKRYSSQYKEQYIASILGMIRQNGRTKNTLDTQDIEYVRAREIQQKRQMKLTEFVRFDADFNGEVSRSEVSSVLASEYFGSSMKGRNSEERANRIMSGILTADANADGVVTYQEVGSYIPTLDTSAPRRGNVDDLLSLDPDKDGVLTIAELQGLAEKAFATLDADGDGIISEAEQQTINASARAEYSSGSMRAPGSQSPYAGVTGSRSSDNCRPFPAPSDDEKIVRLGAYEGNTTATVSVAGQERETQYISVNIDKGDSKLYIVASTFNPVIWQFTGATDRIDRLVLAGPLTGLNINDPSQPRDKIQAGAIGVDLSKIAFRDVMGCGLSNMTYNRKVSEDDAGDTDPTKIPLQRLLGRSINTSIVEYSLNSVSILPDGRGESSSGGIPRTQGIAKSSAPDGFDETAWQTHLTYQSGGLKKLNARDVVSEIPAEDYRVLPGWAGVSQLAGSGKLVRMGDAYRIVQDIDYYPAGLSGALATKFVLASGVPKPKGSPGHSCVKSENGDWVAGPQPLCR